MYLNQVIQEVLDVRQLMFDPGRRVVIQLIWMFQEIQDTRLIKLLEVLQELYS